MQITSTRARIGRLSAACALTLTVAAAAGGTPALAAYNSWAGSAPKATSSIDNTTNQTAVPCRPWLRCPSAVA